MFLEGVIDNNIHGCCVSWRWLLQPHHEIGVWRLCQRLQVLLKLHNDHESSANEVTKESLAMT